eukprot:TRINITY_DN18831_c0_g1_i1.p1 TRINITY_DN18831_c0_g1~~TRINITY_DN18831_c0_g1_i1.p1  ORF type:complete len:809 (+),score=143.42 TRINITY_DN18831_c0_g1_i1:64-2427(+)
MQASNEGVIRDDRPPIVRFLFSLRFVLSALMLVMYASGIVTWKVSGMAAADSVNDLSNKLMSEIRSHITTSLTGQLSVAETITTMNAGLFEDGTFDENVIESFMKSFWTQLRAYNSYVTTVSMTTKIGHLHGVYTDSSGEYQGYWSSNTSDVGHVQLYDFNSTKPSPHEGIPDTPRMLYVEPNYNSSEQEWYTVVDTSIPGHKAWTSIYTMGSQTPVTMLSESTAAYTKNGLMGVTTIDMALGFASELLRAVKLPTGYKAFVVDVKDIAKFGGVQAVIGTADKTDLLFCKTAEETVPMDGSVDCTGAGKEIIFMSVGSSSVPYIATVNNYIISSFGNWDSVTGHSSSITVDGSSHFISVSTIVRPNLRWCVVVLLPKSVFLEDIERTGQYLLVMYISVLVVKALLSGLVIYFFIAPLHRLAFELELLSEFKMDEANLVLSAWGEIRSLQLTFLTLLRQMKVIKSYMPQALFAENESDTDVSDTKSGTYLSSRSHGESDMTKSQATGHQRGKPVRNGLSFLTFETRKHITVLSIRVSYDYGQDVSRLHSLHCEVLELLSSCSQANKGTLDQISSDVIHVLWGRDCAVNFGNIPETVHQIQNAELPAIIQAGAAVGQGFTGGAGGDHIRTVATLTKCRRVADTLSLLAAEHPEQRFLATRRIREHTEMSFIWQISDVCRFSGYAAAACVFILVSKKSQAANQEWLYAMDSDTGNVASKVLEDIAVLISKADRKKALDLIAITSGETFDDAEKEILQRLNEMAQNSCTPLSLDFGYTGSVRTKGDITPSS